MIHKKHFGLCLSLLLSLSLFVLPAAAEVSPVQDVPISSAEELKAALEAPGEGRFSLVGDIEIPLEMPVELSGAKHISMTPDRALTLLSPVTVPEGAELTITGGSIVLETNGPTIMTVEGALNINDAVLYAYAGDWARALVNSGGSVMLDNSALRVSCQQDAAGIYNDKGGSFMLRDGMVEIRSEGGEHGYLSVAVHNNDGDMTFESSAIILANSGLSMGLKNSSGLMKLNGGTLFVTNYHMSTGILNEGELVVADVQAFLATNAEGIVSAGGSALFETSTISFLAGPMNPPNITAKSGGLSFSSCAFVIDTDSRCVAAAEEPLFKGQNVLLRRGGGQFLTNTDGHAIESPRWAAEYRDIAVNAYETSPYLRFLERYTVEGSWPGHQVYVMDWVTQSLTPREAVKTSGETLKIKAEGYLSGRLNIKEGISDSYGVELTRLNPQAGALFGVTAAVAGAMLLYQLRFGSSYLPEKRKERR